MVKDKNEKHQRLLKDYLAPYVKECISENYHTGPMGYLLMVGGEALNYHLPAKQKVDTSDFDLKFVVTPRFTDLEDDLKRANVKRLFVAHSLLQCLQNKKIKAPKGYQDLTFRLTLLQKDQVKQIEIEGPRVFMIDPETKEKVPIFYRFNKMFTIKAGYQHSSMKTRDEFTLIDIGLYYRYPPNEPYYNFLTHKIYNTFLYPPFSRGIPVPFVVEDKIRYPILPYILVDNFRMILFANDFLHIYMDKEHQEFFKKKLKNYHKKMKVILDQYSDSKYDVKKVKTQIDQTVKLYEPLAKLNAKCYREEGKFNFTTIPQNYPECDDKYHKKLDKFLEEYQKTLELISTLMPPQNKKKHSRRSSRKRSNSAPRPPRSSKKR